MSEAPDIIGPLSDAQSARLRELTTQTPVPQGRRGVSLAVAHIDDASFRKNATLHAADIAEPNSLPAGYVVLEDAIVTPFGFLIYNDKLVFDTQILPNGWMRGGLGGAPEIIQRMFSHNFIHKLDIWNQRCLLSVPEALPARDDPAFLFSSRLSWCNFAHLVFDTLVQAPTYLDAGFALTPLLVGPGFQYPAMDPIFRAAGPFAPEFLRNRFLRFKRLYVPLTHFAPAHDAIARGAVRRLRSKLGSALGRGGRARRLFISREDSGRKAEREPQFSNHAALMSALARYDIEPIVASRLSVEDYLEVFANAELIVGLHGAGLTNAVLATSPKVLEILAPGYPDWHAIALFIETGMGAPYRRVRMQDAQSYDIPAITGAVEDLLNAPP